MNAVIRVVKQTDLTDWAAMRGELWPDDKASHRNELEAYFEGESIDIETCFVVENEVGELCGFMELNIRNFAEGSRCPKVPYVEAWFIKPGNQSKGLGKQLMQQAERWAAQLGYHELASDTETDNNRSIAVHKHLGFEETDRVVCFLKKLK